MHAALILKIPIQPGSKGDITRTGHYVFATFQTIPLQSDLLPREKHTENKRSGNAGTLAIDRYWVRLIPIDGAK